MSDRYPWAAEVLALLDAPPESVSVVGATAWTCSHDGLRVVVRSLGVRRANVHIETGSLWLTSREATDVPATVRALLAGLRAAQAALGGVMP